MSDLQVLGTIVVLAGIALWAIERYRTHKHNHLMSAIRAETKED